MIEIKRMFHKKTGEIVFQDSNGDWFMQEYSDYDPMRGADTEYLPVVVTKIEPPEELKDIPA